jgi:hypothetical protein
MTSDISVLRYDELISAGATRVVTKPLPDPAELLRIVGRLLKTRPAPSAPDPAPGPSEDVPLFDPAPLTHVCVLAGPAVGREILDRLMLDLIETLARLDRVGTALRSGTGTESDLAELRSTTHVLIALAGTAGALQLLRRVQTLDHRLQNDPHSGFSPNLGQLLSDIRLLTRGAVASIARLPQPDQGNGPPL